MTVCETVQATIAGGWNTIYKFTRDFMRDVVIVVGKYQIGKPPFALPVALRHRLPATPWRAGKKRCLFPHAAPD